MEVKGEIFLVTLQKIRKVIKEGSWNNGYTNKLDNYYEMDKVLERNTSPKLTSDIKRKTEYTSKSQRY
jgi:hypothetical protein